MDSDEGTIFFVVVGEYRLYFENIVWKNVADLDDVDLSLQQTNDENSYGISLIHVKGIR